jgi:hypothetical protein
MKRCIILLACLLAPLAHADSWKYSPKVEVERFRHGSTRVVLTTDARKNQRYPDFLFEVFTRGKQVARVPGVHFEHLFASKDNRLFVGLSNSGVPGTAAVVFTDKGKITLLADHGLAEFDYCSKSITLERVWYDDKSPNIKFQLGEQEPKPGIYVQSCRGEEIELVKAVRDAYARAAQGTK